MSHPVWVCGLKLPISESHAKVIGVTPCMGVWIETHSSPTVLDFSTVTPCMGVWIETVYQGFGRNYVASHPVWVCGLKLRINK